MEFIHLINKQLRTVLTAELEKPVDSVGAATRGSTSEIHQETIEIEPTAQEDQVHHQRAKKSRSHHLATVFLFLFLTLICQNAELLIPQNRMMCQEITADQITVLFGIC